MYWPLMHGGASTCFQPGTSVVHGVTRQPLSIAFCIAVCIAVCIAFGAGG